MSTETQQKLSGLKCSKLFFSKYPTNHVGRMHFLPPKLYCQQRYKSKSVLSCRLWFHCWSVHLQQKERHGKWDLVPKNDDLIQPKLHNEATTHTKRELNVPYVATWNHVFRVPPEVKCCISLHPVCNQPRLGQPFSSRICGKGFCFISFRGGSLITPKQIWQNHAVTIL